MTRLAQGSGRLAAEAVLGKVKAKNIPEREERGGASGVWTLCSSIPAGLWQSQSTLLGPLVRDDRIPGLLTLGQLRTPASALALCPRFMRESVGTCCNAQSSGSWPYMKCPQGTGHPGSDKLINPAQITALKLLPRDLNSIVWSQYSVPLTQSQGTGVAGA